MRPVMTALTIAIAAQASPALAQTPTPRPTSGIAVAQAATTSPRPLLRPGAPEQIQQASLGAAGFNAWVQDFAKRAQRQGVPFEVVKASLTGIRYDPDIIALDRNQAEFSKQLWEYLDSAVSSNRINTGRSMLSRYATALDKIERRYGVDKEIVVAIWGLESAYGGFRGNTDTIEALATLAYDGRRGAFFEEQLVAALKIVQAGDVNPRAMKGSWAGAMGHTQFMPTSYLDHAVDFTGDGRRDIWSDNPVDALASTAAYLDDFGWKKGQPWGVEVRVPQGFDYAVAGDGEKTVAAWSRLGVRGVDGGNVANHGKAQLLLPAGARGPAFLTFGNFDVIKRYNASTSYAMAVGHLGARMRGAPDFTASWPRGDRALSSREKEEMQKRLTAKGFSTNGIDGRVGPDTIAAIRRYQKAMGLVADGYASTDLLTHLR
ncbi:lytic murein transglycosylase [Meridianimarinicoccus aquatilis]|uniref:Lytic murein transglycosylase n=2 Tax=Meridianimarinicoccus aquatilis TaxID=2552766 RepID=A0A4R6AYI9_9RHOB|nr:lytic murein transglycosylase [Fluviibacterium aquatile]